MVHLKVGAIFEATIDRISNSGNAVIEGDSTEAFALLKSGSWEEEDTVKVKITSENGNIYTAVPMFKEAGAKAPPLHHDGKSAGQTRSLSDAFDSIEDREFNPKTHGAPELNSNKSSEGQQTSSKPGSDSEKSLRDIAKSLDESESTDTQDTE
ncbi:hypothetical protein SAMN05216388_10015 [Halorientalis persicus]|uniref:Uncharacterized protein n=2 Tax=Halorientalis persicus TaxID=1367881 RepID=A0A1H8CMM7_9EURY|nr:hypothetical protein SAMN05216388_10015 [Halorientalis persicus]